MRQSQYFYSDMLSSPSRTKEIHYACLYFNNQDQLMF